MLYTPTQGLCCTSRVLYPTLSLRRGSRALHRVLLQGSGIAVMGLDSGGGEIKPWSSCGLALQSSQLSVAEMLPWGMQLVSFLVANDSGLQK